MKYCKQGHPLTEDNIYTTPSTGQRRCLICKRNYHKINGRQFKSEPAHGTRSGYAWHTRDRKEDPCEACEQFERQYWKEQRKIRGNEINALRKEARKRQGYTKPRTRNRARKIGVYFDNHFSDQDVLDLYGTTCHLCNEEIDLTAPRVAGIPGWERGLHVDHVIPLSKGGPDVLENVKPSHAKCNMKKSNNLAI